MRAIQTVSVLVLLATGLAGCTGNFSIKQTEPFRVQIDGAPQQGHVSSEGSAASQKSEFKIENTKDVEVVKVTVECKNAQSSGGSASASASSSGNTSGNETGNGSGSAAAVILVIVEDRDTHEKLEEQQVQVASGDATQVELNVNVKGKDNVVVITQAVQGSADVAVSAATGEGTVNGGSTESTQASETSAPTTSTYPAH